MENKKAKIYTTIGIAIVIILTIVFSVPFIRYINDPERLRNLIDSYGAFAPLMFVLMSMIQILIPFIPGEPFELLAGYAFGTMKGTVFCLISGCIASFAIIFLVRKYGKRIARIFFKEAEIENLKFLKSKKSFVLYSIAFMLPGTPKDLLCYIGGLCEFDLVPLLMVVSVGRIPAIITSTIPGDALGDKRYVFAIIAYAIAILICLLGLAFYNKTINRKEKTI